ncbi:hypothetical protein BHM03_00049709 [Ensete ventricosum]|nr:hypothetical protein BHM03_00049709 [Ensete ventricosum]
MKKCFGHKLCVELRAESCFDRFFMYHFGNSKYWPFSMYNPWEIVLAKKCDGHKLTAKSRAESSFNRFFVHCL